MDSAGSLLASVGDPARKIAYWRSSAKPFQAMSIVSSGAASRWGFQPEHLALFSSSHNGEPAHTAGIRELLRRIGCSVDDLKCGVHPPLDPDTTRVMSREGVAPTALHSNCSGKHTGMLALAQHLGAELRGYRQPGHPVQQEILRNISRFAGLDGDEIVLGVDGCGVPCFGLSVHRMALAFARLMDPIGVPTLQAEAASSIREGMLEHPYLVAGKGRFDTDIMIAGAGSVIAKGGACGVLCLGVTGGIGIAVKIEDGASGPPVGASSVVALDVIRQLGVLSDPQLSRLSEYARPSLRSVSGDIVGDVRAVMTLKRAASWR